MLNLSRNALGVSGMRKLQRFIVKASFLTHLDMSGCELGCDGVSVLSEYFMCLPLVYLNLARNQVADKGIRSYKMCQMIESSGSSGCNKTDVWSKFLVSPKVHQCTCATEQC